MINEDIIEGFECFLGDLSDSTIRDYKGIIKRFIEYCKKDLTEITLNDYGKYISSLNDNTASYKILVYSALKRFSKYLFGLQIAANDYMEFIERPRFKESIDTKERRANGVLEPEQIKQLKESIAKGVGSSKAKSYQRKFKDRDMAIFMIFLTTGIRCSALCNLDIGNIDFEHKTLTVIDKGDKIKEYVLSEDTWEILNKWLTKRESINDNTTALFLNNKGKRMGYKGVYNLIKKYSSVIKDKNITPHKLRATYGTQIYNATGDIYFVKECMNHSRISTTMLYIRNKENTTKKASEIMNNIIKG